MREILLEDERGISCSVFYLIRDENGELTSEDEVWLEDFFRFRHKKYAEEEAFEPKSADGLERDILDHFSDYLLVYLKGELIAGCRFINGRKTELPINHNLKSETRMNGNSFEISRITIDTRYSAHSFFINFILIWAINIYGQRNKFECAYALIRDKFDRSLKQKSSAKGIDFHFREFISELEEVVGKSFEYKKGENFTPVKFCATRARNILGEETGEKFIRKACRQLSLTEV